MSVYKNFNRKKSKQIGTENQGLECLLNLLYILVLFSVYQVDIVTYITFGPNRERIPVNTVYCIGKNYAEHAQEMNSSVPDEPVVFIKPATAVVDGNMPIVLPEINSAIHYEGELVLLLDTVPKDILETESGSFILGVGMGLDLTARDLQRRAKEGGLPWTISKGFDGSAPVSHFIPAGNADISASTEIILKLNGSVRQQATIGEMIFPIAKLISYLSRFFTLRRGDLLFTGTPKGVGPLHAGDAVSVKLGDIISMSTTVQNV
jgi:2-keto-4-pentenoate hydratase/2-oxohepta-3-ene-1,7-dioic acid hydratase in catechol pathway